MYLVYSVLTQFANKGIDVTLFFHSSPSWKPKKAILWTLFPLEGIQIHNINSDSISCHFLHII